MQLQELKNYLDIDIAESLEERFMDEEAFYLRFLRKLLVTQDFVLLEQAVAAGDWAEALRKAHNLKGVCANLGLNSLSGRFAAIVKLLRSDGFTAAEVRALLAALQPEWERTLLYIGKVED